jgi:hypothetical protein
VRSTPALTLALFALACGSTQEATPTPSETVDPWTQPEPTQPEPTEATDDDLRCEPVNFHCGCTWECALVREIDALFVRLDSEGEQQFVRDDCASGRCFEVCEGERCAPALVMESQECEESCPPTRAPFACARVPGEPTDATGRPCQPR